MQVRTLTRRRFLLAAGATATAAGGSALLLGRQGGSAVAVVVGPTSPRVAAVEQRRRGRSASVTEVALEAAPLLTGLGGAHRSEERRVGKRGVSTCRTRRTPDN